MGICCIPPAPVDNPSDPELLDARLMARRVSKAPTKVQPLDIVEEQVQNILQLYRLELRKLIATGPKEENWVKDKAEEQALKAMHLFKIGFLQGTAGEMVPFGDIKEGEDRLKDRFRNYTQVILFANKRKSYDLCTTVAESLMNNFKANPRLKGKINAEFDVRSVGPMRGLCGDHLSKLMCEYEENGESGMLGLRQRQLRVEQKMLKMLRREALQHCNPEELRLLCGSPGSSCSSELLPASAQSQMSLLDVIRRLPSIDMEDSGRKTPDSEEAGVIVLRQTHGSEASSPPELSADTAASTLKLD